ncbi:hypothetical protein [Oceanibacterium hippocampi]|nr:hypothetical protein [Oceanibacterium hippocampi]
MADSDRDTRPPASRSAIERHAQTLVGFVICGLIGWVGVSVADSREAVARLDERVVSLTDTVRELRGEVRQTRDGGMTKTEAAAEFGRVWSAHVDLKRRVDLLERGDH